VSNGGGAYGSDGRNENAGYGAYRSKERNGSAGYGTGYAEDERIESPKMGESFSAAGLGAIGMLAMPVARPLAVLACVLGIIGLVMSVIVVIVLYAIAGAFAVSGVFITVVSFILAPQDISVTIFLGGGGLAFIGAGLMTGALNYMLGRAIFKGIANLSGRIRHKRVKVRRDIFNYAYTGAGRDYPYTDYTNGNPGDYTARPNASRDYPHTDTNYTDGNQGDYTARPNAGQDYPYTDTNYTNGNPSDYTAQPNAGQDYPYTDTNYTDGNPDDPARPDAEANHPYTNGNASDYTPQPDAGGPAPSNAKNARPYPGVRIEDRPTS
jgi:hypothetical protein